MRVVIAAMALVPLLSGCGITASALQKTSDSAPPTEANLGPDIAVGINGTVVATVKQGSPLFVEAVLGTSDVKEAPKEMTLSASAGGWGSALSIEVRNAEDAVVPVAFQPAFQTEASILLNAETLGNLVWTLDASGAQALSPGEYTIRVRLDNASISGAGLKDKTASPPVTLRVRSTGDKLSAEEESRAVLAEIRVHGIRGQVDAALGAADRRLAVEPKDGLILEGKADTLAKAGRFKEAVAAYEVALSNVQTQEDSPLREPPHGLLRKLALAQEAAKKAQP